LASIGAAAALAIGVFLTINIWTGAGTGNRPPWNGNSTDPVGDGMLLNSVT
tara:strand:+ start:5298 stop:5450 length:153 start_codon:yes stop_codon:yes gene_type:complete